MADITGASLRPIYDRLHGAPEYHPLEADTFADWSMEAGDIVTITREGKNYTSPVHNTTIVWRKSQQVKVSSTGKEERGSIAKASQKKAMRGGSILRHDEYMHYYVEDQYHQMQAGLEATASTLNLYVDNKYAQMRSGLDLTSSTAHLYTDNKYAQMRSGLALTTSTALLYVDNKYAQMQSGLALTASTAMLYVDNKYAQMQSGLALSASTAMLYVDNKYTQMQSGLMLTSSTAKLYTDNKYTQMSAGLSLGVSFALLKVNDSYNQMKSALYLTSSDAHLYVDNKYAQMQSGLALSSSTAMLYVDNKYSQMQSGLQATSSSAKLYTENRTTRAYIMTRINADGEGEALIEASKVSITGTTTINGVLSIVDDGLVVKKSAVFQGNAGMTTNGSSFKFFAGTKMEMVASGGAATYEVDGTTLATMIKTAAVSNNQLTLTRFDGTSVNFNKAVSLSGGWNGGVYTVSATSGSISGQAPSTTLFDLGLGTPAKGSGSTVEAAFDIGYQEIVQGEPRRGGSTGKTGTLSLDVSGLLQSKSTSSEGTVSPDDGYLGLSSVTVSLNLQNPYGTAIDDYTEKTTGDVTANGKSSTFTLSSESYRHQGQTLDIPAVKLKLGSNNIGRIEVPVTDTGIFDSNGNAVSDQTLSNGGSIDLYGGATVCGVNKRGSKVTISAPNFIYKTMRCTSVEQIYPGSVNNYYYFRLEGQYNFSANNNYNMYRTSWT